MCVVSMIGDHYCDKFRDLPIWVVPLDEQPNTPEKWPGTVVPRIDVSREEFEALKRDVLEMKELLRRAKDYDERNGEPDCEIDEKMDLLRKVAKLVGIDLNDVIGSEVAA